MSYYLVLVSPRDIPLYEADLYSKPSTSTSSSFFSSNASTASSNTAGGSSNSPRPSIDSFSSGAGGGVFGFGSALRDLTSGLAVGGAPAAAGAAGAGGMAAGKKEKEGKGIGFGRYNDKHVLQMVAHSSLDAVEDWVVGAGTMYLKQVDRINEWSTSCLLVPGGVKFLILHEHKHDDGIRNFFLEIWEAYLKISLNPFFDANTAITSSSFDARVKASARKHL